MLPRIYIVCKYDQSFFPNPNHFKDLVTVLTGVLALIVEFYQFMFVLNDAIEEFEDVVEEMFLFMYVSSKGSTKNRISLAMRYKAIVSENDAYRCSFKSSFEHNLDGFQCLGSPDERFNAQTLDRRQSSIQHYDGFD